MSAKKKQKRLPKSDVSAKLLDELVERAKSVRQKAHAPYSRYFVGAALATKSGKIFEGCNVENASFGATICAERGAIMAMVAAGEKKPVAIAVATADGGSPCGICRQVLSEFAKDMPVVLVDLEKDEGKVLQFSELLPHAFELK